MSQSKLTALVAGFALLASLSVAGEKKLLGPASAGNDRLDISATVHLLPEEIQQIAGGTLPPGIVVVKIDVRPRGEEALRVDPDDFTLLSYKDGQRSGSYSPSQIAGSSSMMVTARTTAGGMMAENRGGPVWGGIGGTRPQQLGGNGIATGGTSETTNEVKVRDDKDANPVLTTLKQRQLPSSEGLTPTSGLLYFPLEGKHKVKDMALLYKGGAGRLTIEFSGK